MAKILVQVLYDSRDLRSLIIFFSKLVIWDSLSKISFRVTPYFDEKQKNIFRFRSSRALSQGFSNIKTKPNKTKQNKNKNKNKNKTKTKQNKTKQNQTKHIFSNLSHIGLLYKQHPALVKGTFHSTVNNHTMLVFGDLLDKWDKICNNAIGKYSS